MSDNVIIFDTTLRDGEQALQASLSVKEKLQIAFQLERMGVDIIEAGFPVSSPGDFQSVQTIAREIKNSRIAALSRCVIGDIDAAAESLKVAEAFRLHMVLATSGIHVKTKLRKTFADIIDMAVGSIKHARRFTDDVEFSCEDAGRTDIDDLCRIVEAAINAGATTVNIPDTVGYTTPYQFGGIISELFNRVPNIDKTIISVHCHDDLGMSVANSITAVQAGARQIEGTINGLGERAGNCALEEVIMAIKVREKMLGVRTGINHKEIYRTSQLVSQLCNTPVPPNKAVVGSNAFSHSSGIHQDGVIKNRETYEIMTPDSIGLKDNLINLTSRSGRAAVKHRMAEMGYQEGDYNLDELYADFLQLADKKGQVFDYDLEAPVFMKQQHQEPEHFSLAFLNTQSGTGVKASAMVRMQAGDDIISESAQGNGPVDAAYEAIRRIAGYPLTLAAYQLTAKGQGTDALGQVNIVVEYEGRKFHGMGLATDIVESSAQAMIHAINSIWRAGQVKEEKRRIQSDNNMHNDTHNDTHNNNTETKEAV